MTLRTLPKLPRVLVLALVLGALALAGCSKSSKGPTQPIVPTPPNPNSPTNAVRLLQWALQHRDTTLYRTLFTTDYQFVFVPGDPAGAPYQVTPFGYADERASARHLFVEGLGSFKPARTITLPFSGTLADEPDPRPGKGSLQHRVVHAAFILDVATIDTVYSHVIGGASFYLVRGDSAAVPADLIAAGVRADSTRWFIEQWKDETGGVQPFLVAVGGRAGPFSAGSTDLPTWGQLKVKYVP